MRGFTGAAAWCVSAGVVFATGGAFAASGASGVEHGVAAAGAAGGAAGAHVSKARGMALRAAAYLRSQQDEKTGGWSVPKEGPVFPAITALVVTGLLLEPGASVDDPAIRRGLDFILSYRQADGGIYDRLLPSYNTAICLSALALARERRADAEAAIGPAQDFLRSLQWSESVENEDVVPERPRKVALSHPFYGGVGYGRNGRPDNSNLGQVMQAMHDSGLAKDDVFFQRALVFLRRTQMQDGVNEMAYARGSRQGGFIYSTSVNAEQVGVGQVMIPPPNDTVEETLSDGTRASRLRSYGSMTYMGFKSLIYAGLSREDDRVRAALGWIRRNYTLEENPGIGADGLYYFYLTFARAMKAWGEPTITPEREGEAVEPRLWAADLTDALSAMQNEDGSFRMRSERWMENNSVLITAYSLIALRHAGE